MRHKYTLLAVAGLFIFFILASLTARSQGGMGPGPGVKSYAGGASPTPPTDVVLDINPAAEAYADNDVVTTAHDQSGNGFDGSAGGGNVIFKTNQINGLAAFQFIAANSGWIAWAGALQTAMGSTGGTAIIVVKINTDPPGAGTSAGLWRIGTSADSTAYPFTNGLIYDDALSTARKNAITPGVALNQYRTYIVTSTASDYHLYIDASQIHTTATNTYGFPDPSLLGRSADASVFLDGYVARYMLYSRVLNSTELTNIDGWVAWKYGI